MYRYIFAGARYLFIRFSANRGEFSIAAVIGVAILLVSYAMFPELYHNFVSWAFETGRKAMKDAFGGGYGNDPGPKLDPRNLRGDEQAPGGAAQ